MHKNSRFLVWAAAWSLAGLLGGFALHPQVMAQTFENSPIGFASVNANGQNGTTGGAGGQTVTATTASQLQSFAGQSGPLIIQVSGTIAPSSDISVASNKTIIGLGSNAAITGHGLIISGVQNVIVRNIAFSNAAVNSITIEQLAHHVWVDHCDFTNAGDTLMDIKRQANYVTVSWNHFTSTLETILEGHSDTFTQDIGFLKVTYHHNWFDGTTERHPRVRFSNPTHVFNNYYLNIVLYGVASTMNAGVLVEGNFFDHVPEPTLTDISGSAAPGNLVERNNIFVSSGTPQTAGTVIEPSTFYSYTLDPTANIPTIVTNGAGTGKINTNPTPDFSIASAPGSQTVTAGSPTSYAVTVTGTNGFNGTVSLSVSGLPSGATATFNRPSISGSGKSTLSVSTSSSTPAGSFPLTITGDSGSLMHSTPVTLTVNPISGFSIRISPPLVVPVGGCGTTTVTVTPIGNFTGAVTLSVSGVPSGITATFGTNPTSTTSLMTVCASATVATGMAALTITGTAGTVTASTTITLTVNPRAGFTLSASPTSLSVAQGGSATDTITVTDVGGFTGNVNLAVAGLPTGVTGSFGTNPTSGTSVLTLSASSTAATGTHTITITGTSGTTTASTSISLTVGTVTPVTITPVVSSNSPFFVEEDLKLSNTAPITALSITLTVERTTGISFSGEFNTVGGIITQGDSSTSSTITYTFALNSGQTLSSGSYLFAAQMSGTGTAHPTSGDTFSVTYTAGGTTTTQTGHF